MHDQYTEDEARSIRIAIQLLTECDTPAEVYARVDEFRELGINQECVGTIAVMRLGQLGIDSRDERYMDVERFFKFKTVDDYDCASWEEKRRWFTSPRLRVAEPAGT